MKREDTRGGVQSTTRMPNGMRGSVCLRSCKTLALLFGKKAGIVDCFWVNFHSTYASAKARKLDHRLPIRGNGEYRREDPLCWEALEAVKDRFGSSRSLKPIGPSYATSSKRMRVVRPRAIARGRKKAVQIVRIFVFDRVLTPGVPISEASFRIMDSKGCNFAPPFRVAFPLRFAIQLPCLGPRCFVPFPHFFLRL